MICRRLLTFPNVLITAHQAFFYTEGANYHRRIAKPRSQISLIIRRGDRAGNIVNVRRSIAPNPHKKKALLTDPIWQHAMRAPLTAKKTTGFGVVVGKIGFIEEI
jgi:hypothetical protein